MPSLGQGADLVPEMEMDPLQKQGFGEMGMDPLQK